MDTAVWLNNKIGSDDNQWNSSSIASHFTTAVLANIYDCFLQLELKAKIKILLSVLEIPLHAIGDLQKSVSDIVNLAECDPDEWVRVAANIVKDYASQHIIDKRLENVTSSFEGTIQNIRNELELIQPSNSLSMVPLEAPYLNRVALNQMVPNQPTHMKHFTLRRRPKSAELRAKITQKAADAANQRRVSQSSSNTTTPKSLKRTNSLPTGRLPPVSHSKSISKTSLPKKTKLLDIDNLPLGVREQKKRKKVLAMEACLEEAKQRKLAAEKSKIVDDEEEKPSVTSPCADVNDSDNNNPSASVVPQQSKDSDAVKSPPNPAKLTTPSYALLPGTTPTLPIETPPQRYAPNIPNVDPKSSLQNNAQMNYGENPETHSGAASAQNIPSLPNVNNEMGNNNMANMMNVDPNSSFEDQSLQRELQMRVQQEHEFRLQQEQFNQQLFQQHARQYGTNIPIGAPGSLNAAGNMGAPGGIGLSHQLPPMQTPHVGLPASPAAQPQPKKGLSLTREQMLAAQEMFRSANRVTRAEKALILGFMAGARENPFPQQGPVITIKLSEDSQELQQPDGPQTMVIEMLFEMNYETGHWRRLKRTKVVSQQQQQQQQQQPAV